MTFAVKKASGLCAAFLGAALGGLTGCATPKIGEPDLNNCMVSKKTKVLGGLVTFHETEFSDICSSAKFAAIIAGLKDNQGNPDPAGAAVAIEVYAKLSKKEQQLADAMMAQQNLSIETLHDLTKSANDCQTRQTPTGKTVITCAAPFRPHVPANP